MLLFNRASYGERGYEFLDIEVSRRLKYVMIYLVFTERIEIYFNLKFKHAILVQSRNS
jgi:hypothetical protein